jgi:hypothetical protein
MNIKSLTALSFAIACLSVPLNAQTSSYFEGVIDSRPANAGTMEITMEESVMGRLAPQRMPVRWLENGTFAFMNPGERQWKVSDIEGNVTDYEAPAAAPPRAGSACGSHRQGGIHKGRYRLLLRQRPLLR